MKTLQERVESLLTWPDNWNGYNVPAPRKDAVLRARDWILGFRERIGERFSDPDCIAGSEDCIQFDWFGSRYHLSVFVDDEGCSYLRVWGYSPLSPMDDGSCEAEEEEQAVWNWFLGGADEHYA